MSFFSEEGGKFRECFLYIKCNKEFKTKDNRLWKIWWKRGTMRPKLIKRVKDYSYSKRLEKLGLTTSLERRMRSDLVL